MNISWSTEILQNLAHHGVRDVVFCAGARNSPLIAVLSQTDSFRRYSFFEERSAGFFALGIARRTGRSVAIITTSGTAVAELLAPTIEAFHTGVPLILVTADRPRRLRGTGAPQSIDQTGIFAKFVEKEFDLENGEMFSLDQWDQRSPVHLNICFDEPLLDTPVTPFTADPSQNDTDYRGHAAARSRASNTDSTARLEKFLESEGGLLVVVGTLETQAERSSVARFLSMLRAPAYLESTSGLRESAASEMHGLDLKQLSLRSGERVLAWGLKEKLFTRVLRIGGIPTVRIWRNLEDPTVPVRTLSISSLPFSGLSRGEMICAPIAELLGSVSPANQVRSIQIETLLAKDREASSELERLLESEPHSEPALIRSLSRLIPADALVYVGNSLPIREWDLAADYARPFAVEANRGVNGIDGQVSTFLGIADESRENWAVIGDLTALYDLPGPWALEAREPLKTRIVVVNNGGGQIFRRIFRNSLFENRHSISFEPWATLWGLSYERWTQVPSTVPVAKAVIIELVPNEEATQKFWDGYDRIWEK
jgi:2-succinyl-5-enolpyruvyl-6-hydroxy-3-cyclohexene-1-carboxylate synthase